MGRPPDASSTRVLKKPKVVRKNHHGKKKIELCRKKVLLQRRKGSKQNGVKQHILYNETIAGKICSLVIEGYSLPRIAKMDRMPSSATIYNWLSIYPEFKEMFLLSKQLQMDYFSEALVDIPDTYADVQRGRLKSENLRWLMSKLASKKYGDKTIIGGDSTDPIKIVVEYKRSGRHQESESSDDCSQDDKDA